jgi:hypothetical protein
MELIAAGFCMAVIDVAVYIAFAGKSRNGEHGSNSYGG